MTTRWPAAFAALMGIVAVCEGFNVLVVGQQGSGKSRVVNAALHGSGLVAHPVVVGGRAATKAVTVKVGRFCVPKGDEYVCWYDTPGMDLCPCLSQWGICDATEYLKYLIQGVIPGTPWPPAPSTPTLPIHTPDLILFTSSSTAASAASCGRRLALYLANQSTPLPVAIALTAATGSTTFAVDSTPIVSVPIFAPNPDADELLSVVEGLIKKEDEEEDATLENDVQDADDSIIKKLTAEEAALGARLEAWSAEKQHRVEENRKADIAAWETAKNVLLFGLGSVGVSLLLRFASYLLTTGVGTTKRTVSWVSIAGGRLSRLGISVTKTKSKLAAENSKKIFSSLQYVVKSLLAAAQAGLVLFWGALLAVLAKLSNYVGHLASGFLRCVEIALKLFPDTKKRFVEWRLARAAAKAEMDLQKRGVQGAKICTSCMTPLDIKKTGVEVQTSAPNTPLGSPVSHGLGSSAGGVLTPRTPPSPLEEKQPTQPRPATPKKTKPGLSWRETWEKRVQGWKRYFRQPGTNEVVDVLWTDDTLYEATVLAVNEADVNVRFASRGDGDHSSLSVVPLDRVLRRPLAKRWETAVKFVMGVVMLPAVLMGLFGETMANWREEQRKAAEERRKRMELAKLESWDRRKADLDINSKSPLRKRRNSLPVVPPEEMKPVVDFPSEHRQRRTAGRDGGYFMDTVGAPVGTTFQDICSAADSLQSSLHKRLSEQPEDPNPYEIIRRKTSALPNASSITPIRTPYGSSAQPPHHLVNPPSFPGIMSPPSATASPRYSSIRRAVGMSPSDMGRVSQGYGRCSSPLPVVRYSSVGRVSGVAAPPPPSPSPSLSTPVSLYASCEGSMVSHDSSMYGSLSDGKGLSTAAESTVFLDDTPVEYPTATPPVPTPIDLPLPVRLDSNMSRSDSPFTPSPVRDPTPTPPPSPPPPSPPPSSRRHVLKPPIPVTPIQEADEVEMEPLPATPVQSKWSGNGMWGTLAATTSFMTGLIKKASPLVSGIVGAAEPPTESPRSSPVSEHDSAGDVWVPSTAGSTFVRRHSSLKSALKNPGSESSKHSTSFTTDSGTPKEEGVGWAAARNQAALNRRRTENDALYSAFQRERDEAPSNTDALFGGVVPKNMLRFQSMTAGDASADVSSHRGGYYSHPTTPIQTVYETRSRSYTTKRN